MKILLLGGDGQLGKDCQKVLSTDHELIIPTEKELDLCVKGDVYASVARIQPDVVLNCAAFTAVDACEERLELSMQVNGDAPRFLAEATKKNDARLIHISTDYVFSGKKQIPQAYTEEDSVDPLSQYGRSKLAGEAGIQEMCSNYLILRTAWLYSAHGPNFLKTMLRLAVNDPQRQLKVVNDQYGSLTWSHTLALQIQLLIGKDLRGIIHTTADGYSTWYEAACYFLDRMNVEHNIIPCATKEYPTPARRPANSILSNTRLDKANLSTFTHWQKDIDTLVQKHRQDLLKEAMES